MVEDSYPGLTTRYTVAVVPAPSAVEAITISKALGFVDDAMPLHVRTATKSETIEFAKKSIAELRRASSLSTLMPYFDNEFIHELFLDV